MFYEAGIRSPLIVWGTVFRWNNEMPRDAEQMESIPKSAVDP